MDRHKQDVGIAGLHRVLVEMRKEEQYVGQDKKIWEAMSKWLVEGLL